MCSSDLPENISAQTNDDVPLVLLEKILSSPDFGGEKEGWRIVPRKERERPPQTQTSALLPNIDSFLANLERFFASGLRVMLVIASVILAVSIFIFARKYIKKQRTVIKKTSYTLIQEAAKEDPKDILKNSQKYFEQGNLRMAWGYLTTAAILMWQVYNRVNFPPNATETECAKMTNIAAMEGKICADKAKNFCSLVMHWINFAYAGHLPSDESFEKSVLFCNTLLETSAQPVAAQKPGQRGKDV